VVGAALASHRELLERQRSRLTGRINQVDRYLKKGISMPSVQYGCRPVQIKLAADDASTAFYDDAFHERAIAAGVTELMAPRQLEGMPRSAVVKDPAGTESGSLKADVSCAEFE
jgi:hypothetical protein